MVGYLLTISWTLWNKIVSSLWRMQASRKTEATIRDSRKTVVSEEIDSWEQVGFWFSQGYI